jgi:glycosyltransferase involved in cell wall biosynthesis
VRINRKKILYVVSTLSKTGPTVVLSNIVKYLDRYRFDPEILTLSPEPRDSMAGYFRDTLDVRVESLGFSRARGILKATSGVSQYVERNNVDLIHTHGLRPDWVVRNMQIRRVSTLHNYPYSDYTMLFGETPGTFLATIHLRCLKKIDHPVVVSQAVSEMLRDRNHVDMEFVRNGVDVSGSECLEKNTSRGKLKIESDAIVFISVGSLTNRKDPMTIIASFQKANVADAVLLFLGDGECRGACESMAIGNPNIRFAGRVDNVQEYLCASDYFLSASLAEGLPNSVLEAMAVGLPCVLSDIPPHREIHDIDAKSSLLFKAKDTDDMAASLSEIVREDSKQMHDASINITHNYLSAEVMSNRYQEIYDRLLEQNRRPR